MAQAVLKGETQGYTDHPQLERFYNHKEPLPAISAYLKHIYEEANERGFNFDERKIGDKKVKIDKIAVSDEQLMFEFNHLKNKLLERDLEAYNGLVGIDQPDAHPLFVVKKGSIANWERIRN